MNPIEKKEPSFFGAIGSFFTKTEQAALKKVDDVMAAFHNTVADLEGVAKAHTAHALEHAREIEARTAAKLAAEAEAIRASNIAKKMKAIFE